MSYRLLVLVCGAALSAAGFIGLACSSDGGTTDNSSGGSDATVSDTGSNVDSGKDTGSSSGGDDGGVKEGGGCSAAKGACDLVLQDCPDKDGLKQECVPRVGTGGLTTICQKAQNSQLLPQGRACCPNNSAGNECLPGLKCIGADCTIDGGPKTGRCSPYCCPGSDSLCGSSSPEGIAGTCDVRLTTADGKTDIAYVCSYKERCKPFGVEPCKTAGSACVVEDKNGTSSCQPNFNPPAANEHQSCGGGTGKDCADGLGCFTTADGGGECLWFCRTPNSSLPFDAGLLEGGVGRGGCPGGETCKGALDPKDFPGWMSVCLP
jgi:hypothetical protein